MGDRYSDWPSRLQLAADAFVAPGASLIGEITLGSRVSVWFGVAMRGDCASITIGDDSNLQDLTVVHVDEESPVRVGARVTIGHRAIIHGCTIEDDCLIGMGAIVLSGARIGAGSLIGAGALIKEGQVIPPGSLAVGAPARVIGPVSEAHRAAITGGAKHYVAFSRGYLARGVGSQFPTRPTLHMTQSLLPMTEFEWAQRLAVLAETPHWVVLQFEASGGEGFRVRPAEHRWSALEVMAHLADCDREVYLPRVLRALSQTMPVEPDVAAETWVEARGQGSADPEATLASFREARAASLARLEDLGPSEWARMVLHPVRGPHTLADVVRYWTDHDLSHRRQMGRALETAR